MPNPLRTPLKNVIPINRIDQKKCRYCGKPVHRNTDPTKNYLGDWIHTGDGILTHHRWACATADVEGEENSLTRNQSAMVTVLPVSIANLAMQNKKRKFRF